MGQQQDTFRPFCICLWKMPPIAEYVGTFPGKGIVSQLGAIPWAESPGTVALAIERSAETGEFRLSLQLAECSWRVGQWSKVQGVRQFSKLCGRKNHGSMVSATKPSNISKMCIVSNRSEICFNRGHHLCWQSWMFIPSSSNSTLWAGKQKSCSPRKKKCLSENGVSQTSSFSSVQMAIYTHFSCCRPLELGSYKHVRAGHGSCMPQISNTCASRLKNRLEKPQFSQWPNDFSDKLLNASSGLFHISICIYLWVYTVYMYVDLDRSWW